ncbi:MAG: hypothetical protein J5673_01325 [Candidatus Methanomethylophilaceae archaeon]|nr:hypothetical protein [Candidatus Methanomethylophilaceae archaeon]
MATDNRNKEETRSLVISDFRNLGVSALKKNKDDTKTFLKINRSLKKDELGGLVVILGSNNSGKSNVLEAMAKYPQQVFTEDDETDFISSPKPPKLEMDVANNKYKKLAQPKILAGLGRCTVMGTVQDVLLFILRQTESFDLFKEWTVKEEIACGDVKEYVNDFELQIRKICRGECEEGFCRGYAYALRNRKDIVGIDLNSVINDLENGNLAAYRGDIEWQINGTPIDSLVILGYKKVEKIGKIPNYVYREEAEKHIAEQNSIKKISTKVAKTLHLKKEYDPSVDVILIDLPGGVKPTKVVDDAFSKEYGYNLSNRVFRYTQSRIVNADLTSGVKKPNSFITNVFSLLGYRNKSILKKYYDTFERRKKIEDDLNERLRPISELLNQLLRSGDRKYRLGIRLEAESIIFTISYGDININLDHQSEGFRWMFGFFINFLMSNKFVAGDIVIIDEFGGLLNFGTVKVLSDNLREFSKKHGITFIIATQNPMAVDIRHLDEIRMIMPREDGGSDILNDFTEFANGENMDVLEPIVGSMTIGREYLRSGNRTTVFVENYTDYFYLNGFNKLVGLDIDFIPLNGIIDSTSVNDIVDKLRSLERAPMMLVDMKVHDKQFVEILESKRVKVIDISVAVKGKETVADLFSEEDKARLLPADASFDRAACLSYSLSSDASITDETRKNFEGVLNYISIL